MTTTKTPRPTNEPAWTEPPAAARRFGYIIAIGVNVVLISLVQNIVEWDVLPWLTAEFNDVVPWINFSLFATILVNAIYLGYDEGWFKSLTQAVLGVIAFVVTLRLYQVFPFDFTAYDPPWTGITEVLLIFVLVATAIGAAFEAGRFVLRSTQRLGRT